ncbi:helix-turn-helix domain-containing protein [Streptomyces sp. NPDC002896]|uniref:helix-turn-helix domain-containing protein n=1 Tax=Streptomyces sp. NPDC002896 TaxID=3154438 RepID=UPI003324BAD2
MRLRYAFRLYPNAVQQTTLARGFGCARVVFNDAVHAREDARTAGQPFPTAGELYSPTVSFDTKGQPICRIDGNWGSCDSMAYVPGS